MNSGGSSAADDTDENIVRANPLINRAKNDADDKDDIFPTLADGHVCAQCGRDPPDGADHAVELGCCAQCNSEQADAPLTTGGDYPPSGVFLHPGCRKPWLRRYRVGRFRKVGDVPPDMPCIHCYQVTGEAVARYKDTNEAGGQGETLHLGCAPEFFDGK
jgi:hypothetical protein